MSLSAFLCELLDDDVRLARAGLMGAIGHDPAMHPHFWEAWVATVTTGSTTPHKEEFDVLIPALRDLKVEVKFSRGFSIAFNAGRRRCFKWLMSRPQMSRVAKPDAVLMIGVDSDQVWMWCCRPSEIGRSITVTVPCHRRGGAKGSRFDAFEIPPADMLPAILRVCHNTYDMLQRRVGANSLTAICSATCYDRP